VTSLIQRTNRSIYNYLLCIFMEAMLFRFWQFQEVNYPNPHPLFNLSGNLSYNGLSRSAYNFSPWHCPDFGCLIDTLAKLSHFPPYEPQYGSSPPPMSSILADERQSNSSSNRLALISHDIQIGRARAFIPTSYHHNIIPRCLDMSRTIGYLRLNIFCWFGVWGWNWSDLKRPERIWISGFGKEYCRFLMA
jgi:hypothetical protein